MTRYGRAMQLANFSRLVGDAAAFSTGINPREGSVNVADRIATNGHLRHATDALAISARPIPKNLLRAMRGFGMVGPAIGAACLLTGSLFLVAQTLYDEWNSLKRLV